MTTPEHRFEKASRVKKKKEKRKRKEKPRPFNTLRSHIRAARVFFPAWCQRQLFGRQPRVCAYLSFIKKDNCRSRAKAPLGSCDLLRRESVGFLGQKLSAAPQMC